MCSTRHTPRIYDCRQDEDFEIPLPKGTVFSSLKHRCIVLYTDDKSYFRRDRWRPSAILDILQATAHLGFYSIYPMRSLPQLPLIAGDIPRLFDEAYFGHFDIDPTNVSHFMSILHTHGSYEEWLIGSCSKQFNPVDAIHPIYGSASPGLHYFLERFEHIGALWYFNLDYPELIAIIRSYPTVDEDIQRMLAAQ